MSNIAEMPRLFPDANMSYRDQLYGYMCFEDSLGVFVGALSLRAIQIPSSEGLVNVKNGFKLLSYGVAATVFSPMIFTIRMISSLAKAIFTLSREDLKKIFCLP